MNNVDSTAGVFDGNLYINTSYDGVQAFDVDEKPVYLLFCMPGYRFYSCNDAELKNHWYSESVILREEDVHGTIVANWAFARM